MEQKNFKVPTSEELIKLFELPNQDFIDPYQLEDSLGFSVKRVISEEIAKKLGCKERDKHITFIHLALKLDQQKESIIPIFIRTGLTYFDGNSYKLTYEDIKKVEYTPIEVFSRNEYYIDINTNSIYNKKDQPVKGLEVLNIEYNKHIRPAKRKYPINSFFDKSKMPDIYTLTEMCQKMFYAISWDKQWLNPDIYDESKLHSHKIIEVDFNGSKLNKNSLFWFSTLHLIAFSLNSLYFNYEFAVLKGILNNNFLIVMYGVTAYILFDYLLVNVVYNKFFKKIISILVRMYYW